MIGFLFFFFTRRRRHTIFDCDWSSAVCSSDLLRELSPRRGGVPGGGPPPRLSLLAALASGRALSPASTARVPPRVRASASRAVRRARERSLRRRDACRGPGPRARPPPSPPALRPPPPRLPPPRARAAPGAVPCGGRLSGTGRPGAVRVPAATPAPRRR